MYIYIPDNLIQWIDGIPTSKIIAYGTSLRMLHDRGYVVNYFESIAMRGGNKTYLCKDAT